MPDLDLLRELGQHLRKPDFEELLDTRRGRTRRTRIAVAAACATVAGAVVAVSALVTPGPARTDLPPVDHTRTPTTTEPLVVPAGQRTILSDVGAGDVHGFDVLATVTSAQPEHQGESELTAVVPDTREAVSAYCRADADLYYFLDTGDGSGAYDRCSPDSSTSLSPEVDIGDEIWHDPVGAPQTIRMWIARPSADWLRCQRQGGPDCTLAEVPAIAGSGAEFGFAVYAHRGTLAFELLEDAGNGAPYPIQALSSANGIPWLVDRAVVAAPDADRLVLELPSADRDRLVDVYPGVSPHLERCRARHADQLPDRLRTDTRVYADAFDRWCGVDLRLVVDGDIVAPVEDPSASDHFRELGARLSAATAHEVVVEVVRGDPRDVTYAVVVRSRTRMP